MREIEFRGKTVPQLLSCKKDENGNWVQKYTESEWVYGYYAPVYLCERDGKTQNKYAIISDEFIGQPEMIGKNVNTGLPKMFEILENTLGQYTGLKDKNGKKIFEGDIVEVFAERNVYNRKQSIKDKYIKIRGVIEFGKNTFYGYGFNINYQNKYNDKLCEPVGKETCQRTLSHWDLGFYAEEHNYHDMWKFKDEIKVIGNIFDNGELLNED